MLGFMVFDYSMTRVSQQLHGPRFSIGPVPYVCLIPQLLSPDLLHCVQAVDRMAQLSAVGSGA